MPSSIQSTLCINSFNLHNRLMSEPLIFLLFYRQGNWHTQEVKNLTQKHTTSKGRVGIGTQSDRGTQAFNHDTKKNKNKKQTKKPPIVNILQSDLYVVFNCDSSTYDLVESTHNLTFNFSQTAYFGVVESLRWDSKSHSNYTYHHYDCKWA